MDTEDTYINICGYHAEVERQKDEWHTRAQVASERADYAEMEKEELIKKLYECQSRNKSHLS
jgi:hypothetical protein